MLDDDSSSSPCIKGDVSVRVRVLFGSFSVIFFWHSCDVGWLNVEPRIVYKNINTKESYKVRRQRRQSRSTSSISRTMASTSQENFPH